MRRLLLVIVLLAASAAHAASYTVTTSTTIFDGTTDCSGACAGGDILIVEGGIRSGLTFKNLNGAGSHIYIRNESATPDAQVQITSYSNGLGYLNLEDCKYVDLDGSNDPGLSYGFYIEQDGATDYSTIRVYGESDHIKIGYVYMDFTGADTNLGANGIQIQDASLDATWTFDTFEIHHNYIDSPIYTGMYLGHNWPPTDDNPYTANFSIHDNTVINSGGYGLTHKGIYGGTSEIYNNTFIHMGLDGVSQSGLTESQKGFGVAHVYNSATVNVHDNFVADTYAMCFNVADRITGTINVYDNVFAGCRVGNAGDQYNAAVAVSGYLGHADFYDNIIVQPETYGIYVKGVADPASSFDRNIVAEATTLSYTVAAEDLTLGAGADANTAYADADTVGFVTWSDDSDYTNDNFAISTCSDGVQGGDETGVDCGGSCDPCSMGNIVIGRVAIGNAVIKLVND